MDGVAVATQLIVDADSVRIVNLIMYAEVAENVQIVVIVKI